MFKQITGEFGPVDVLVNNAGMYCTSLQYEKHGHPMFLSGITKDMLAIMMKPNDFTDVINLNLNGVFFCAQVSFTLNYFHRSTS
jgi:NAD(P)-dependent dehydrogenase (short-subunit alcohol dehydrogenase family)